MSWSWYIMGFVNIDGSYDVSPLYTLVVMNWIFTLWSFVLSDWMFRSENTWCMSCGMNTWGDNGVSYWFTWCMLWHSTCRFPRWHWGHLCIGVDAHFFIFSPIETLGSPCSSSCGLNIMIMKLFDAYHRNNSRILVVTLKYLGDIRVGWCVSYGVILVWTRAVCDTYRDGSIDWSKR